MNDDIIDFRHRARLRPPTAAPTRAPCGQIVHSVQRCSRAPSVSSLLGPCWTDPFLEEMKRLEPILNPPWLKAAIENQRKYHG